MRKLVCPCCGLNHPHACGDKAQQWETPPSVTGSSPRVWGQVGCRSSLTMVGRIIPTRVGTSLVNEFMRTAKVNHPHACGDKLFFMSDIYSVRGSSPRVWGQAGKTTDFAKFLRIIPTRVGTSTLSLQSDNSVKDHPHACGDKLRRG